TMIRAGFDSSGRTDNLFRDSLAGMDQRVTLVRDARHQLLPRLHERLRAVTLQLDGESVGIDAGLGESREHAVGISAVLGHDSLELAVLGKGEQCLFGYGVDRVRRCQGLDVQGVRRLRILGSSAAPKQALRTRAGRGELLPAL